MTDLIETLDRFPADAMIAEAEKSTEYDVRAVLAKEFRDVRDLAILLSPAGAVLLEELAVAASLLTTKRFGRTVLLYAPLYLSNECVNICTYCGFRRDIDVARSTLAPETVEKEAIYLIDQGFKHLLLVSGEHPKWVGRDYMVNVIRLIRKRVPSVSIEIEPLTEDGYRTMVDAGADGVTVYQEVYDRKLYAEYHTHGPKKNYDDRLGAPSRAARARVRRVGIGSLLGLAPWRPEILKVALHAGHLMKDYWRTHVSISFPRIREAASGFHAAYTVSDRDLAQMICALRLVLPDVGLVLSTRESRALRDGMVRLGITQMSAGSRTEPGGYLDPDEAERQFDVNDTRSPAEVAARLHDLGFEPVWKDWEEALHG